MFERLTKAFLEDRKAQEQHNEFFIIHGYCKSWRKEQQNENDNGLKRYSTARRWEQYQAGEIDRAKACKFAIKRMSKKLEKETSLQLAHLEAVAKAPNVDYITVNVEYRKSYAWGYIPTAEVITSGENDIFTGYASGCGYDKESAAVAEAFNKSLGIMKVLYTLKEKALEAGENDKSETACTGHDNRNIIGYGAGYSVIPYFEGGVGVDCFWSILKKAGFKVSSNYGKHENFYRLNREA
jgi:hypothetical protein